MADGGDNSSNKLVIFGITGDLARKMTYRALYRLEARKLLDCPIVGVASDDMTKEKLVERTREAIKASGEKFDDAVFDRLAGRLSYLHGDVTDEKLYGQLAKKIGPDCRPLYYLEMPPSCSRRSSKTSPRQTCWNAPASRWKSRSATTWPRRAT